MDLAKLLSAAFQIGLLNALGLLIFVFIGKTFFVKALDTAASKAIEVKKHDFAKELEDIRQKFAKDLEGQRAQFQRQLEAERQTAARALEEFKADLAFGAEVRRQVAHRKVGILLEIVAMGEPLIRTALDGRASGQLPPVEPFTKFMDYIRTNEHFFAKKTVQAFHAYNHEMMVHMNKWNSKGDHDTVEAACKCCDGFLDLIRTELGVG